MSEITITVSRDKRSWIEGDFRRLSNDLIKAGARTGVSENALATALTVIFGKEQRRTVLGKVKNYLAEVYCARVKREYLEHGIPKTGIDGQKRETLIRALTTFDGDNDRRVILSELKICGVFSIDGFYNFKMQALRRSWNDLCSLAKENMPLAAGNDYAYELLLRFLLSTVEPKSETVKVVFGERGYNIETDDNSLMKKELTASELIDSLVDIAPVEIVCDNSVVDGKLISRLSGIFDIKRVNNLLYFCENR